MIARQRSVVVDRLHSALKRKSTRRRVIRYGLLSANVLVLGLVITFIVTSSSDGTPSVANAFSAANDVSAINPVDRLTSYDIAANIARTVNVPEKYAVKNEADSIKIQYAAVSFGSGIVSKPQIVKTALKSRQDIRDYTVQAGDTVASIAQEFGVTSDSIRWSNNLVSDSLHAGTKLAIPPVNGIVYTVRSGDTIQSLASRFKANAQQITAYNDAELSGIHEGERIIIPDGKIVPVVPTYYNYSSGFAWGASAIYGFNGYDPGNCTWYVANMRLKAGNPVPSNLGNAESWLAGAQAAGMSIGRVPRPGAVIWYNPRSGPFYRSDTAGQVYRVGHVGYVDSVDADGTAHISDMNVRGLYSMSYETYSAAQAGEYWYIY